MIESGSVVKGGKNGKKNKWEVIGEKELYYAYKAYML